MVRKKWSILAFILMIGFLMVGEVLALDPEKAITQYIIAGWNDETGLPSNYVRTILQTSDGYIWFGTNEGLARFDGVGFTVFDEQNTPAMTNNHIYCLYETGDGMLLMGTVGSGLLVYKNGRIKSFTHEKFNSSVVLAILEDDKKNLWIGTDGDGLFKFSGGGCMVYTAKNGLPDNTIKFLYQDSRGNLCAGTADGLVCFKDDRLKVYSEKEGLKNDVINTICEDSSGNFLVGTDKGVYVLRGDTFTSFETAAGINESRILKIFADRDGNLWVGTASNGLFRCKNGRLASLTKENGLSDNTIFDIKEDREGSLWVSTTYGGINQLKDGKFTTITTKEGLSDEVVFAVIEDSRGYLWFGTNNGLNRYKNGKFKYFTTRDGLTNNVVNAIYEDPQGILWVGTDDGVNKLGIDDNGIVKQGDYVRESFILGLSGDTNGNIWIGTHKNLYRLKGKEPGEFKSDCMESNLVNFIYEDSKKNVWLSTYRRGLMKYNHDGCELYTRKHGLASHSVNCIYEDNEGVLWIGTIDGLSRYKNGKFTTFTRKDGLFNNNIYRILEDKKGNLWMSSNKGIFRVGKQDLHDAAEGKIAAVESIVYGKEDGMSTNECNGGLQSAGCKTADGHLYFPTTRGVVVIDPENIDINEVIPPVFIERVLLDGVSVDSSGGVKIRPGVKRVELHYTAASYLNPRKIRFKYKLEGYDEKWVAAGTHRAAWYTNLDGGSYSFRVIACNDDGIWNRQGASIGLTVIPPFWKTWWFTVIALVAFAFFSYVVIHLSRKYITLSAFWKRQKIIGQFKLLDKIGSGGMGTIYRATNLMDRDETVALKVLREDMFEDECNVKRFKQEAAIIDQLDHPNIVKVIERGQSKNNLFIAMELLKGKTLAHKIKEEKKIELKEAVHIMAQVADALAKIHSKNIIHRDMKPDNIMLVEKGGDPNFVKLLDFGLAKMQHQTRLTQTGIVIGTINYLSPEQISGRGSSPASDIYALGIMFYEIITGEKPFIGETTIDIMKQIIDKTPIEPIRFCFDMSFELNHLIMKMLEKDAASRPPITGVLEQLRSIDLNLLKVEGR